MMIEQALAIATSTGRVTQATIQIPTTELTMQEPQQIEVDGQQVDITVEQVDDLEGRSGSGWNSDLIKVTPDHL